MAYGGGKKIDKVLQDGTDSIGTPTEEPAPTFLHDGSYRGKQAFLASFTPSEDGEIMRKVDMRFLWLIGITYLIKNSTIPNERSTALQYFAAT